MSDVYFKQMSNIFLKSTLNEAFKFVNSTTVKIKSALVSLSADIFRFFKIYFGVQLNDKISEKDFRKILKVYPKFSSLSVEQFNRFCRLYCSVRNLCAHLYLSYSVSLDSDLKEFIEQNCEVLYPIEINNELTIYGAVIILSLLSKKIMIWPFCTAFFRSENFTDISATGEELSLFQINMQKLLNNNCGFSGSLPTPKGIIVTNSTEYAYINDTLKRYLTNIFFDLEKSLSIGASRNMKKGSLANMLSSCHYFNEPLISKIIGLRNCWLHGTFIGDVIERDGENFKFTFEYVIGVLKELQSAVSLDCTRFKRIIRDVESLGEGFLDFYVLRLVEVSYKVLDSRVFLLDKIEERLNNSSRAFKRLLNIDSKLLKLFSSLITKDVHQWNVHSAKFLDKIERAPTLSNLKIAKIHCAHGFKIGDYSTNQTDIVLAIVPIDKDCKILINEHDLESVGYLNKTDLCKFVSIVDIEM